MILSLCFWQCGGIFLCIILQIVEIFAGICVHFSEYIHTFIVTVATSGEPGPFHVNRGEGMEITLAEVLLSVFISSVFFIMLKEIRKTYKDSE